jgi:hypothetical protein
VYTVNDNVIDNITATMLFPLCQAQILPRFIFNGCQLRLAGRQGGLHLPVNCRQDKERGLVRQRRV